MINIRAAYDPSDLMVGLSELEDRMVNLPLDRIGTIMLDDVRPKTPVRTGRLRDANEYRVESTSQVTVDNPLDYAIFVDEGTRYMDAQPFMITDYSTEQQIEDLLTQHLGI